MSEDPAQQRAAISAAMVGLKKEHYGRGPTAAKTYFDDDWVFCVLEGGLTRSEETLLAAGEAPLVRQYRLRFQEAMKDVLCGTVQEITGREVLSYHSQIMFDPDRVVEMFLLAPLPDGQAT